MVSSPVPSPVASGVSGVPSPTSPISPTGGRPGILRRAWVRLAGEADPIERQLAATAKEGATLAHVAHLCAFLMLLLFSLGSLVALAGDSVQAIASGHITLPAIIAAGVSTLLVACMDTGMLYAASMLRLLAARRADKREGRLHRFVLAAVAILEAATYGYMSYRYEMPHDGIAWALIGARALAAPLLSVYLALARPLPVMARDMLALGERIAGEGVLRDLAHIAGDASAPLVEKVALYIASAVIAPEDATRLQALLDVAQRREMMRITPPAIEAAPAPSEAQTDDGTCPPTGPGSPTRRRGVRTPAEIDAPNVVQMPTVPARRRRRGKAARGRVRTASANVSAEAKARTVWRPGMSVQALQDEASISRPTAQKYNAKFTAEDAATAAQSSELRQSDQAAQ